MGQRQASSLKYVLSFTLAHFLRADFKTHRNEQIWNLALVFLPSFPILCAAFLDIPNGTVDDHTCEEERVKPRKWRVKASDCSPGQSEEEIAGVMDLASVAICSMSQ